MCMEDVRIGRKTYVRQTVVDIGADWRNLIGPSPTRVSITFGPSSTIGLRFGIEIPSNPAGGLVLEPGSKIVKFDITHDGNLVTSAWYGCEPGGVSGTVTILETFLVENQQ